METSYFTLLLENKDILTTIAILPILWFLLKGQKEQNKNIVSNLKESLMGIKDAFTQHDKDDREDMRYLIETISDGNKKILANVGKTKLDSNKIVDLARNKVWFASEAKLAFIKNRLEKNALAERKEIIKKHIKTELITKTQEYVEYLNNFTCSIGLVGDYIWTHFPMDPFMEEIYDVVFRNTDNGKEAVLHKIQDIRFIMLSYQNDLFEQMKSDIKKVS